MTMESIPCLDRRTYWNCRCHGWVEPNKRMWYIHCQVAPAISILLSLVTFISLFVQVSPPCSHLRNIERNIFQKAMEEDSETDDMPQVGKKFGPLNGASCAPHHTADEGHSQTRKVYPINLRTLCDVFSHRCRFLECRLGHLGVASRFWGIFHHIL